MDATRWKRKLKFKVLLTDKISITRQKLTNYWTIGKYSSLLIAAMKVALQIRISILENFFFFVEMIAPERKLTQHL